MASDAPDPDLDADDALHLQSRLEQVLTTLARTTDPDERRALTALASRASQEQLRGIELHLLPLVRRTGTHGEDVADAQVGHHTAVKDAVIVLRRTDPETGPFVAATTYAAGAVRASGRHLEEVVLPLLRQALADGQRLDRPPSPRPHTARGGGVRSLLRWWRRSRSRRGTPNR